jgi:23S rRNA pseudouridine955/2504/2580 synthase
MPAWRCYTPRVIRCTIHPDEAGQRADRFVRKLLPGAQLGFVFKLFRQKKVRVNGARAEQTTRLEEGDELALRIPDPLFAELSGQEGLPVPSADGPRAGQVGATGRPSLPAPPLEILFEDEHVLALLKPAGILVQPGPGDHAPDLTSVVRERYAERYAERPFTPSPAHRLDLGTSGLVLFGMSAAGLRGLSESFRARDVDKRYLALVQGVPDADAGEIDLELSEGQGRARAPKTVPGPGRAARTEWTLVARGPAHALLEVRLHTGRLHQIRAHLSALDMPIVGDGRYGAKHETRLQLPRRALLLHAYRLRLPHPVEAGQLELEAPLPGYFAAALTGLGLEG